MKRWSTSLGIREMQIKAPMGYPLKWLVLKRVTYQVLARMWRNWQEYKMVQPLWNKV